MLYCILIVSYVLSFCLSYFFFFNDPATTEIYTLSLHDALPISGTAQVRKNGGWFGGAAVPDVPRDDSVLSEEDFHKYAAEPRSEEYTSELQSHSDLVCRLLLEKKKKKKKK